MRRHLIAIPIAVVLLAGCGPTTHHDGQPVSQSTTQAAGRCETTPADLLAGIAQSKTAGATLTVLDGAAWRSPDYDKTWFVAITIKTAGATLTGVWVTDSLQPGGGLIMSVDATAHGLTRWPLASGTDAQIQPNDRGVAAAKACLQ